MFALYLYDIQNTALVRGGDEPEHRGPNFRPHSLGGHRHDVHNALTVPRRRRQVAVGGALDSKPGGE